MLRLTSIFLTASLGSVLVASVAQAAYPDGTSWRVTKKTCDAKTSGPRPYETIYFASGMFAQSFRSAENDKAYCVRARAHLRVTQNFSSDGKRYQETAMITPQSIRNACFDKTTGSTVSDQTGKITGAPLSVRILLQGVEGSVAILNSPECKGELLLDLVQKK